MKVSAHGATRGSWHRGPATAAGRWAVALTMTGIAAGLLGEVARRTGTEGPLYPLAFAAVLGGGVAAMVAVRGGERSPSVLVSFVPFLIALAFGLAELLGGG